jgi:hypothetical protein
MYCPKCGKEVENGARFCNWCGSPMPMNNDASEPESNAGSDAYSSQNAYRYGSDQGRNTYQQDHGYSTGSHQAGYAAAKQPVGNKKGLLIGICCGAAAVVIILIVVLGGAIGGKGSVIGKWRLNYDSIIDVASEYLGGLENFIDTDYIKDMVDMEVTFEEDGTLIMEVSMDLLSGYSGTYTGTYEITGDDTMILNDDSSFMSGTVEYEVNGNTLTLTENGIDYVFDRAG